VTTVLDGLREKLRALAKSADGTAAPVTILWTDPQAQFAPAVELLRQSMPELVELGEYSPELRRGPAIWLRCVVERTLTVEGLDVSRAPIIYMPGVARQSLRAGEDCPLELRPLVELLYRGAAYMHQGGQDQTLGALLKSDIHFALDVAGDTATNRALLNAVREVLSSPVESLRGRRLEAEDFNKLVAGDTVRDLLRWIGDATGAKAAMPAARWTAFIHSVQSEYGLRLELDGQLTAAELLCKGEGKWAHVWKRFEEAPDAYPGLVEMLGRVEPTGGLFANLDARRYVKANDAADSDLDAALADLQGMPRSEVIDAVRELEQKHGYRRKTVWAQLGRTRYANALKPLAALAQGVSSPLGGITPIDFVTSYEQSGWKTDLALLDVVALLDGPKDEHVLEVAQHLVTDWLDDGARAFQSAVGKHPLPNAENANAIKGEEGCCILFVDGLRYDLGQLLADSLEGRGCKVDLRSRWAALPTVTATAKPAVTPVADDIVGKTLDASFAPRMKTTQKVADAGALRAAITARGGQVIMPGEFATALGGSGGGWREDGQIDGLGHKLNAKLAREVRGEVRRIADSVQALFDAGWERVRVVTDHGWLLLPGGLPKVELSKHLASTKWARCALIEGTVPEGVVLVHWHWNAQQTVATPPGIGCFSSGQEYAHGGVSIQECLIPELLVKRGAGVGAPNPSIADLSWNKYRCHIDTKHATSDTRVDVRIDAVNGRSVLKAPRALELDGTANIPIEDEYEKKQLVIVLLDAEGTVIAQRKTRVGENP
jgi:hypothetical protein